MKSEQTGERKAAPEHPPGRRLVLFLAVLAVFLLLVLVVRIWILEPFQIASASMEPALIAPALDRSHPGDTILVNRLSYLFGSPSRWEVVVFRPVEELDPGVEDSRPNLVKRVVGLPGETVEIEDGEIHVNGHVVPRPSGLPKIRYSRSGVYGIEAVHLGPDQYFCLGDNSYPSIDSRRFGPVPARNLVGRAIWIVWPPRRAGWIN